MPSTVRDFAQEVVSIGLISAEDIDVVCQRMETRDDGPAVETLADELVRQQRLTEFQRHVLLQGDPRSLILGDYIVRELIGAGGMGQVYTALHRHMQRVVAIKVLPPRYLEQPEAIKRFEREVRVAARLSHPNIVTAYDAGQSDDVHYLVMEYVRGANLQAVVKALGPMTLGDAVCCVLQAARGLAHAHAHGVVHRDIKPSNLLIDSQGVVKVLDLGLARLRDEAQFGDDTSQHLSESGVVMGTVDFLAPEQAVSSKQADQRADVYSLGCTLYYLLTAKPVFHGLPTLEKLLAHRERPAPSLQHELPETPPAFDAVFARMLAKDPADRYPTMEAVAEAIRAAIDTDLPAELVPSFSSQVAGLADRAGAAVKSAGDSLFESTQRWSRRSMNTNAQLAEAPTQTSLPPGRGKRIAASAGLAAALLALAAGVLFMIRTRDGTLVLEVLAPDAIVYVDDKQEAVIQSADKQQTVRIAVDPGKHRLKVTTKDGTTFSTQEFHVEPGQSTPPLKARFEPVKGATEQSGAVTAQSADARSPRMLADDATLIEVSQDGAGHFRTLGEALAKVKPGMTIRVVDESVYRETILLGAPRHHNITLEATKGATLTLDFPGRILVVDGVPGIRVRGFKFKASASPTFLCIVARASPGVVLEDLEMSGKSGLIGVGVSLEGLQIKDGEPPLVVRGCKFANLQNGIRISGMQNDYATPMPCRGLRIVDNLLQDNYQGILLAGSLSDVLVAGNRLLRSQLTAIQFENLLEGTHDISVVNNTLYDYGVAVRLWDASLKGERIVLRNNLNLGGSRGDWQFIDNGGNSQMARGPGDGASVVEHWTMSHNWREAPAPDSSTGKEYIPPAEDDNRLEAIDVISRNVLSHDFLRPPADSALAAAGAGNLDARLPRYIGAVPPQGVPAWEWAAVNNSGNPPAARE